MKKKLTRILAVMLALILVMSLAACGSSSSSDDTDTSADASEDAEDAAEEDTAEEEEVDLTGMKAALIVPLSTVEALTVICDNYVSYMAEYGVDAVTASMEADTATCISLIETYVADDYDLITIIPLDATAIEDAVASAREAGVMVALLSTEPDYEVDGGLTTDYETCGYAVAQMAMYWVAQNYADADADSVGVAVVASESPENYLRCKEAIISTTDDDEIAYVAYTSGEEVGGSVDAGYSFAEEALTADPNIRVFICNEPDSAKGINNYLIAQSDLNLDEYCVVAINTDDTAAELVTLSETDSTQSVLRGLIPYGSEDTGRTAADISYALLSGTEETPYWMYDELYTNNSFGWTIDMLEVAE